MALRRLSRLLSPLLVTLGVVVVLFEELLWAWLGRLMALIGRWSPVARIEAAIRRLPPYPAMALFLLPWAVIVPVKLVALALIAMGRVAAGVMLFAAGEIFGVAFLARLYALCRPALHSLGWFVRAEAVVLRWSRWAHDLLDRIPLWRRAKAIVRGLHLRVGQVLAWLRALLGRQGGGARPAGDPQVGA